MTALSHQRAAFAAGSVLPRFPAERLAEGHADRNGLLKALKGYRTVALAAGVNLRACGLLQMTAFWLSKKNGDPHRELLGDIVRWLVESPVTRTVCQGGGAAPQRQNVPPEPGPRLVSALLERSSQELALLECEAEELCAWLKRYTEALWVECRPQEEADDDRGDD